jgi:hypothetical protein
MISALPGPVLDNQYFFNLVGSGLNLLVRGGLGRVALRLPLE